MSITLRNDNFLYVASTYSSLWCTHSCTIVVNYIAGHTMHEHDRSIYATIVVYARGFSVFCCYYTMKHRKWDTLAEQLALICHQTSGMTGIAHELLYFFD